MTRDKAQKELLTFIVVEPFSRQWEDNGLTEADRIALEQALIANPNRGATVVGAGGFKKIRLAGEKSNQGKSGGCRAMYLYVEACGTIFLTTLFGKSDRDNISKADRNALANLAVGLERNARERRDRWLSEIPKR